MRMLDVQLHLIPTFPITLNETIRSASSIQNGRFGNKDIGWQALGPALAMSSLSSTIVILRWYTRACLLNCLGLDDFVIFVALILSWAMCGIIAAEVHEGVGSYTGYEVQTITKLVAAANIIWIMTVNVTKISLLIQYLRIFQTGKVRLCSWILLFSVPAAVLYSVIHALVVCRPIQKIWDNDVPGRCDSEVTYWLIAASINILLDLLILTLPMPAIASLRLPKKQKRWLMLVFLLGFLVTAVGIARAVTVYVIAETGRWVESGVHAIIWSAVEADVGIICASLLALRPFVAWLFPSLMVEEEGDVPRHCLQIQTVSQAGEGNAPTHSCCHGSLQILERISPPSSSLSSGSQGLLKSIGSFGSSIVEVARPRSIRTPVVRVDFVDHRDEHMSLQQELPQVLSQGIGHTRQKMLPRNSGFV